MGRLSPRLVGWLSARRFTKEQLKDPSGLLRKLQHPQDPLSTYIRHSLSEPGRDSLDACEVCDPLPESTQKTLVRELNRLLRNPSLYDSDTFQHTSLSRETRALIDEKPGRWKCIRLNRLLLEQVFPSEIYESYSVNRYLPYILILVIPVCFGTHKIMTLFGSEYKIAPYVTIRVLASVTLVLVGGDIVKSCG